MCNLNKEIEYQIIEIFDFELLNLINIIEIIDFELKNLT